MFSVVPHELSGLGAVHFQIPRVGVGVQVTGQVSVHHMERARFDRQLVEHRDIAEFPVGNRHKRGTVAAQVQQPVPLHGGFKPVCPENICQPPPPGPCR